jgi:predicted metal-dependent hydrolase
MIPSAMNTVTSSNMIPVRNAAPAIHAEPVALENLIPGAVFKTEVQAWAHRMQVTYRTLHLRNMRNKWASCSIRGRLTFNTDLLEQPAEFRRQVIVHELLHLKLGGPQHDKRFNAMLRAYLNVFGSSN